jgi:hypothetical protein
MDKQVSDAYNHPLQPWVSTISDDGMALGNGFQVEDCGVDSSTGRPIEPATCSRIMGARWVVVDSSGQPAGGWKLLLYIGEEDGPNFDSTSPLLVDTVNARTTLQ